ncbi:MAG: hypothetical protein IPM51_00085 [Sphingobacteriaceae bacterium]|nr:hypothetical protein [Sphingobacteriaceae bacterium]
MLFRSRNNLSERQLPSLVIIGNHTQGLGIIHSAGSCKLPIFVLNDEVFSSSRFSKYISNYIKISHGTIKNLALASKNEELTNALLSLPIGYPSILMGINEDIINYIYTNKNELSKKYYIPNNSYHLIFDKYEFNRLLEDENKVPTYLLKDIDRESYLTDNYIMKSRVGNKLRNFIDEKAIKLNTISQSDLESIYSNFNKDELIIQEIIKSKYPVKSSCAFSIDGEIIGLFQYEKLRQHPNQFGTGTYLKSFFDAKILDISQNILAKLRYTGISEIEFILDERDNNYKIIEMNPRTWKSINFSSQCGQNLVEKYIQFVLKNKVSPSTNYKIDYYWVDLFTDIPQMFREKRIFKYSRKNLFECMFSISDPLPFISTILFSPILFFKKIFNKRTLKN